MRMPADRRLLGPEFGGRRRQSGRGRRGRGRRGFHRGCFLRGFHGRFVVCPLRPVRRSVLGLLRGTRRLVSRFFSFFGGGGRIPGGFLRRFLRWFVRFFL